MPKHEFFENEINLIKNEDYRKFVIDYLDYNTADYFYEIGASSTGRYHPQFSQGEGGLVRHTKAVVFFANELLKMSSYSYMCDEYKDYVIMACILHDTCKYGRTEYNKEEYSAHAHNASENVREAWADYFGENAPTLLTMAIASHMGQWTENKEEKPFTSIDRCVHLADYIASRNFIDIPIISEVYEKVVARYDD